jgi:hypothetical protein
MTYVHPSDTALHSAIDRLSAVAFGSGDKSWDNAKLAVPSADAKVLASSTLQKS